MRRRERHGRIEVGPGIPTPDVSGSPPASQVRGILQFDRSISEREMEEFALRWTRQYGEPSDRDYLADALAAEEHRQGLAYGGEADHCGECEAEALRMRQAECEHAQTHDVELTTLGQARRELLRTCEECGLSWREEGAWL